jgi:hypothetical protein
MGEGHAALTVKSDKGEFVFDNQNEKVVAWIETGYHFVKRQSQSARGPQCADHASSFEGIADLAALAIGWTLAMTRSGHLK